MNSVLCLKCGERLISKGPREQCLCENRTMCEGGDKYQFVGGRDLALVAVWNDVHEVYVPTTEQYKQGFRVPNIPNSTFKPLTPTIKGKIL